MLGKTITSWSNGLVLIDVLQSLFVVFPRPLLNAVGCFSEARITVSFTDLAQILSLIKSMLKFPLLVQALRFQRSVIFMKTVPVPMMVISMMIVRAVMIGVVIRVVVFVTLSVFFVMPPLPVMMIVMTIVTFFVMPYVMPVMMIVMTIVTFFVMPYVTLFVMLVMVPVSLVIRVMRILVRLLALGVLGIGEVGWDKNAHRYDGYSKQFEITHKTISSC